MAITIPAFPQDRGPLKVDPVSGSTLQDVTMYCKDITGCGTADYTAFSQSVSINECDSTSCTRDFVGSLSISGIVKGEAADVETLADFIRDNIVAAFQNCP